MDVGCYDGRLDDYFVKYTDNLVIGIEIHLKALKIAHDRFKKSGIKNIEFVCASATHLPIKEKKMDWAICNHIIDCIQDKEKVIEELSGVINNNGLVYLSALNKTILNIFRRIPFLLIPFLGAYYGRYYPSPESPWTLSMHYNYWKKMENKSFFKIIDVSSYIALDRIIGTRSSDIKSDGEIKKIDFLSLIISRLLPSWVFVLRKNN